MYKLIQKIVGEMSYKGAVVSAVLSIVLMLGGGYLAIEYSPWFWILVGNAAVSAAFWLFLILWINIL